MNLMMKRFGSPSDSMFTKLFGNSVDPQQQIKLPVLNPSSASVS